MACHDVGRALNNVVWEIMRLYDSGEGVSKEAAKKLINRCALSVYWCDGYEYEATDYIRRCVCGRCFKLIPKGEKLFYFFDSSDVLVQKYNRKDEKGECLATPNLCEECFEKVVNHYLNDEKSGKIEIQKIMNRVDTERYTSTGQYSDTNNGLRWVDYN